MGKQLPSSRKLEPNRTGADSATMRQLAEGARARGDSRTAAHFKAAANRIAKSEQKGKR